MKINNKKVIFFSGAGISAESGISTFRDTNGLWQNNSIEEICTVGCLDGKFRNKTINFYNQRRKDIENKKPNKAHLLIARLQKKYPNNIKIITQNVDDLFEKANCKNVLHLHGYLKEIKCENKLCNYIKNINYKSQEIKCDICKNSMRPNIVFFGEIAPKYEILHNELKTVDAIVVIGTSGNVINTDYLIKNSKYSILNNLEKNHFIDDSKFNKVIYNKATSAIDEIYDMIESILLYD